MSVLVQSILDAASDTLNDVSKIRYTLANQLQYYNDGIHELAIFRPDLFTVVADIPCVAGTVEQRIPAGGMFIIDVYSIKNGPAVDLCEVDTLRTFRPSWRTDPPGPAQNWLRHPEDPTKQNSPFFDVYPAAPDNQTLTGEFPLVPDPVLEADLATATLPVADPYQVPLQAYIVYRSESKDDEHVDSGRAALFRKVFEGLIEEADKEEVTAP